MAVAFEIDMRVQLVKAGWVEVIYSKETLQENDGFYSGVFQVFINEELKYMDNLLNDDPDNWKEMRLEIPEGEHEVTLVFQKYNTEKSHHLRLEIKVRLKVTYKIRVSDLAVLSTLTTSAQNAKMDLVTRVVTGAQCAQKTNTSTPIPQALFAITSLGDMPELSSRDSC